MSQFNVYEGFHEEWYSRIVMFPQFHVPLTKKDIHVIMCVSDQLEVPIYFP
jgi:hypothetical protein